MLRRVIEQDTEPDPPRGGHEITEGVARDRVISPGDTDMHAIVANQPILAASHAAAEH